MSKKIVKIIVPIVMLTVVMGIWFVKNSDNQKNTQLNISDGDFGLLAKEISLEELGKHNLPMIIDFGADECVPCKEMAPVLVEVNAQMQGKAIIKFVDVWKNPEAARGFPVQVIPTQILVNSDGTPYMPSKDLGIEFLLYADKDTEDHIFTAHQGGLTKDQMLAILQDMGTK